MGRRAAPAIFGDSSCGSSSLDLEYGGGDTYGGCSPDDSEPCPSRRSRRRRGSRRCGQFCRDLCSLACLMCGLAVLVCLALDYMHVLMHSLSAQHRWVIQRVLFVDGPLAITALACLFAAIPNLRKSVLHAGVTAGVSATCLGLALGFVAINFWNRPLSDPEVAVPAAAASGSASFIATMSRALSASYLFSSDKRELYLLIAAGLALATSGASGLARGASARCGRAICACALSLAAISAVAAGVGSAVFIEAPQVSAGAAPALAATSSVFDLVLAAPPRGAEAERFMVSVFASSAAAAALVLLAPPARGRVARLCGSLATAVLVCMLLMLSSSVLLCLIDVDLGDSWKFYGHNSVAMLFAANAALIAVTTLLHALAPAPAAKAAPPPPPRRPPPRRRRARRRPPMALPAVGTGGSSRPAAPAASSCGGAIFQPPQPAPRSIVLPWDQAQLLAHQDPAALAAASAAAFAAAAYQQKAAAAAAAAAHRAYF